jgi:hypothetical protein
VKRRQPLLAVDNLEVLRVPLPWGDDEVAEEVASLIIGDRVPDVADELLDLRSLPGKVPLVDGDGIGRA